MRFLHRVTTNATARIREELLALGIAAGEGLATFVVDESPWHRGYPQPEDSYLEATYDVSGRCPQCGIGAVQRAPFRMKGEPGWGRNEVLQLNWIFGEYFVTPAL